MSRLEPDELTRLLMQAVEPIRPDPAAYQRIKEGISWRRRWRAPGFALAGIAAATLVVLAVLAVRPGQSAQVVEPATPILSSRGGGSTPDASSTYRIGSGGNSTEDPDNTPGSSPGGTGPATSASVSPTATPTPHPSASTPPDGGSGSMPPPAAVPATNGDVDGDGSVDALRLVGTKLEVTMTRGGAVVGVDVPNAVSPLAATVVDLDRDGYGEVLLQTGVESGVKRFSVLRLAATNEFHPVDESGGLPLVAGIDTLRGVAYGFRCSATGSLTTYVATTTDLGATFIVVTTTWRLDDDVFSQVDSNAPGTSTTDRAQFAASCGDLR